MSNTIKQLRDASSARRVALLVSLALALTLVAAAERDIQHRRSDQLRGGKWLWRLLCTNAVGALGYFRWARRATP
jgi:hypothetical protein